MAYLYKLTAPSGKAYIGVAVNFKSRWSVHKHESANGSSKAIHRAMRRYGFDTFKKEVLLVGSFDYVREMEIRAIASFGTFGEGGYNLTAGGDGSVGYKHSEENLAEMKAIATRRLEGDPAWRAKVGKWNLGRKQSKEALEQRAATRQAKGVLGPMTGKKHSEETKRRISEVLRGNEYAKGNVMPEEIVRRIADKLRGRKRPPHVIEMLKARKGTKRSPESIERMRVAARKREDKKRELRAAA